MFRGTVHGIEAAVKVISHKVNDDKPDAVAKAKANGEGGGAAGEFPPAGDSTRYDEARMRERKRALLRDAHELAVTSTISHPNIVQMYGYFTDCIVVGTARTPRELPRHAHVPTESIWPCCVGITTRIVRDCCWHAYS